MTPRSNMSTDSGRGSHRGSASGGGKSTNDEYRKKRARNNKAVKKSREKTKEKTQQMLNRVTELRGENDELEKKIEILSKELSFLRDLFLEHAGAAHNGVLKEGEISQLLRADCSVDQGVQALLELSRSNQRSPPQQEFS